MWWNVDEVSVVVVRDSTWKRVQHESGDDEKTTQNVEPLGARANWAESESSEFEFTKPLKRLKGNERFKGELRLLRSKNLWRLLDNCFKVKMFADNVSCYCTKHETVTLLPLIMMSWDKRKKTHIHISNGLLPSSYHQRVFQNCLQAKTSENKFHFQAESSGANN